jgi:TPR repeat protein
MGNRHHKIEPTLTSGVATTIPPDALIPRDSLEHEVLTVRCGTTLFHGLFAGSKACWEEILDLARNRGFALAQAIAAIAYCWDEIPIIEKDAELSDTYGSLCLKRLRTSAHNGCKFAQLCLGLFLELKIGVNISRDLKKAAHYYNLSAAQNDSIAQCQLVCLQLPESDINYSSRASLYGAADQGCSHANYLIGLRHDSGGGGNNMANARNKFAMAADQGHVKSIVHLGDIFFVGHGVCQDWSISRTYYRRAEALGCIEAKLSLQAMCMLSDLYMRDGVVFYPDRTLLNLGVQSSSGTSGLDISDETAEVEDPWVIELSKGGKKAFEAVRVSAEQGCVESHYRLGVCFEFGHMVAKDISKALYWYEKAARQGHCKASILAAGWYLKGSKVGKDVIKARMLLNRAACQGSSDAQVTLAREIENQFEPLRVVTKAVKWYRVAATHGNVQAWKSLGHYYLFDSNAANTDYIEGASAFCQGAILGCPECLRNLAECYMKGIGVPKINLDVDYEQVLQWLATEVKRHRNS